MGKGINLGRLHKEKSECKIKSEWPAIGGHSSDN